MGFSAARVSEGKTKHKQINKFLISPQSEPSRLAEVYTNPKPCSRELVVRYHA
jgi:hypothetical protein